MVDILVKGNCYDEVLYNENWPKTDRSIIYFSSSIKAKNNNLIISCQYDSSVFSVNIWYLQRTCLIISQCCVNNL